MTNLITPTIARAYFLTDGTIRDNYGDTLFHPLSTVNEIQIYVEDGEANNVMSINYNPEIRRKWATHWFPCFYRGLVEHTLDGESEPRTFAQYLTTMPVILSSMNQNSDTPMGVTSTLRQQAGNNLIGSYPTVASLPTSYGDWLDLQDMEENNVVAYVYEAGVNGFYMVEFDVTYSWVLQTSGITNYVDAKQYDVWELSVQAGFGNPGEITELSDEQYRLIWQELSQLSASYESNYDLIQELIDGTTPAGRAVADQNGNVIDLTYQLLSNLVTAFQATPDDTHYPSEKLLYDTIQNILSGVTTFTKIRIEDPLSLGSYVDITYKHTNGNNYVVTELTYPDGRVLQVGEQFDGNYVNKTGQVLQSGNTLMTDGVTVGNQAINGLLFDEDSPHAIKYAGVVTVDNVADNTKSKFTRLGIVSDVELTTLYVSGQAYAEGDIVYARQGTLSNVAPDKPCRIVGVGIIININGTKHDILVAPLIRLMLGELSDVYMPIMTDGDVPQWKTSTLRFEVFNITGALLLKEDKANKGQPNGYTPLNSLGYVDPQYIPGAYDDYEEYDTYADLPNPGVEGIMYIVIADETSGGNTSTYRWTGTVYVQISNELSAAEVKALYESNADTNAYTDAEKAKVVNVPNDTNTELGLKVDKTTTIAGVDLEDDITKSEMRVALDINNTDNTSDADKPISDDTQDALNLKRDNDPTSLAIILAVNEDIFSVWDVSTSTLKKMTLGELLALIADGTTTFINSADYKAFGLGAYKTAMITYHTLIFDANGDFKVNIKAQDTGQIAYFLFPTITNNVNPLRISTEDGANYKTVLVNSGTTKAENFSEKLRPMKYDGTNWIYDGSVPLPANLNISAVASSTNGEVNPIKGISQVEEILAVSPEQSVADGDAITSLLSDDSFTTIGILPDGTWQFSSPYNASEQTFNFVNGNKYFIVAKLQNDSVGRIRSLSVVYSDSSTQNVSVIVDSTHLYGIITANKSLLGNIKFVESTAGTMENDYIEMLPMTNKPYENLTADEMSAKFPSYIAEGINDEDFFDLDTYGVNLGTFPAVAGSVIITKTDETWTLVENGSSGEDTNNLGLDNFKLNTQYTFSGTVSELVSGKNLRLQVQYTDETAPSMFVTTLTPTAFTFVSDVSKSIDFIRWHDSASGGTTYIEEFMINEGTTAKDYATFNKANIKVPVGISVGDVQDRTYPDNGVWKLERKNDIDTTVLKATTGYTNDLPLTNTSRFFVDLTSILGYKLADTDTSIPNLSVKIGDITYKTVSRDTITNDDVENYFAIDDVNNLVFFRVNKTTYPSVASWEAHLAANDVTFRFELATADDPVEVDADGSSISESVTTMIQNTSWGLDFDIKFDLDRDAQLLTLGGKARKLEKEMIAVELKTTTAEEDLRFSATFIRQGATFKPDIDIIDLVLLFPQNDPTEIGYINAQLPHAWEAGSVIEPHVHIIQEVDLQAVFKIDYRWFNGGDAVPGAWTTYIMDTYVFTYVSGDLHQKIVGASGIDGTGMTESSVLQMKLYRDDNVYTGDCKVIEFDIHYRVSKFGKDI